MIHVAVLWLVNEHNELLLAQRALDKDSDPGVWGPSVTGRLDPGESDWGALVREVKEELGLEAATYEPVYLSEVDYLHPDGQSRKFYTYYAVVSKSIEADIVLDVVEVAAVRWVSYDEVLRLMSEEAHTLVPSASEVWPSAFDAQHRRLIR